MNSVGAIFVLFPYILSIIKLAVFLLEDPCPVIPQGSVIVTG